MHSVFLFISTKTGFAPQAFIAWKSAALLKDGVITSSPSFIPNIIKDKCKAACPVLTATTVFSFFKLPKFELVLLFFKLILAFSKDLLKLFKSEIVLLFCKDLLKLFFENELSSL